MLTADESEHTLTDAPLRANEFIRVHYYGFSFPLLFGACSGVHY